MKRIRNPHKRPVYPARILFTAVCILCHGTAWGHAGAIIDSIDVNGPFPDGQIGLETSVGYLQGQPDGDFSWVCHEAVTQADAIITPRYTQSVDGTVLVIVGSLEQARDTSQALYRSENMCDWSVPEGLTGQKVADVAFDPNDSQHVLAVTANPEGPNSLFRSRDAGRTWTETSVTTENRIFRNIQFGGTTTQTAWLAAVRHETDEGWVYHSTDGGLTWVEHAVNVPAVEDFDVYVDVAIADNTDPNKAWIVVGPFLDDELLETTDGGRTFTEVYAPDGDIIDGAQDASGGLWLITTGNKVIHSETGEFFQRVDSAPMSLGVATQETDVFLATRIPSEGFALSIGRGGTDFEPNEPFSNLSGPPDCNESSDSYTICEPLWPDLASMIDGEQDSGSMDTATNHTNIDSNARSTAAKQQGCCSSQTKSSNAGLLVLMIAGLRRRRKHHVLQPK